MIKLNFYFYLILLYLIGCENCNEKKIYYPDGTLSAVNECFINGKKNGLSKTYFQNGILESESYWNNDIPNGEAKYYYQNGSISAVGNFKDGVKHGSLISYDSATGKIDKKGMYNYGKFNGIEYFFDKNGKEYASNIFKADTVDCFGNYKKPIPTFWKYVFYNEDYWITAKFDTLNRKLSKVNYSFSVNHTIADSIRLTSNNIIIFKWPEDKSTNYKINLMDNTKKDFKVYIYFRSDLNNKEYADKDIEYTFKLPFE